MLFFYKTEAFKTIKHTVACSLLLTNIPCLALRAVTADGSGGARTTCAPTKNAAHCHCFIIKGMRGQKRDSPLATRRGGALDGGESYIFRRRFVIIFLAS